MCRTGAVVESNNVRLCDKCTMQRQDLLAHLKLGQPCAHLMRLAWDLHNTTKIEG